MQRLRSPPTAALPKRCISTFAIATAPLRPPERPGVPDVLVISPSINVRKPLLDITEEEFDRVVGLNLKGIFRALKVFAPGMVARGKGSTIVFSSIRAQVVEPGQGVYAATKAGTLQMIRALAAELGQSGVRANAIAPGIVETPLTQQIKQNDASYLLVDGGWTAADGRFTPLPASSHAAAS
jgi:NAD(P)-dependent dehydrogenase (short-subunit alcohol dehydrogenase family)